MELKTVLRGPFAVARYLMVLGYYRDDYVGGFPLKEWLLLQDYPEDWYQSIYEALPRKIKTQVVQ